MVLTANGACRGSALYSSASSRLGVQSSLVEPPGDATNSERNQSMAVDSERSSGDPMGAGYAAVERRGGVDDWVDSPAGRDQARVFDVGGYGKLVQRSYSGTPRRLAGNKAGSCGAHRVRGNTARKNAGAGEFSPARHPICRDIARNRRRATTSRD